MAKKLNSKKPNPLTRNIFAHIFGYAKYGQSYINLIAHFNQFWQNGIHFEFYEQPRHTITKAETAQIAEEHPELKDKFASGISISYANDVHISTEIAPDKIATFYAKLWEKDRTIHQNNYFAFLEYERDRLNEAFKEMKFEFPKFAAFLAWLKTKMNDLLNTESLKPKRKKIGDKQPREAVNLRAIKIAVFVSKGLQLMKSNYKEILQKFGSDSTSNKILQNQIKATDLKFIKSRRKENNTKLLNDLRVAETLLCKDPEALKTLQQYLSAFQTEYDKEYK